MPRIPAAIAVVMLVATCIGFNTARFPVVLEMAAVPEISSQTKSVLHSQSSDDTEQSNPDTDDLYSGTDEDDQDSKYGQHSTWSGYESDNADSQSRSGYKSSSSFGSDNEEEEEGSDNSDEEESSSGSSYSSYGYGSGHDESTSNSPSQSGHKSQGSYGSYDADDGDSDTSEEKGPSSGSSYSSYGYGDGHDESGATRDASPYGNTEGYGNDDDSSDDSGLSSAEFGYKSGSNRASDDDDSSSSVSSGNSNRRTKNRSKGQWSGSSGNAKSQATSVGTRYSSSWQNPSEEDSNSHAEYDSDGYGNGDTKKQDTYAQSTPYESQDSEEDQSDSSSYSNAAPSSSYEAPSSSSNGWSTANTHQEQDAYSYDGDPPYGEDASAGDRNARPDSSHRDGYAAGQTDGYVNGSSGDDHNSVARYGQQQKAAADDSSTWSGGVPVTASPAGPYAYGSRSYENSAAASANVVPKSTSLGLVPVTDESENSGSWSNDQSGYPHNSPYSNYSSGGRIQDQGSSTGSLPPDFKPLPPIDPSVDGPFLSPLADGSIPLYPSTEAL